MCFKIVSDSSSNLYNLEGIDYSYVSLTINCENREFKDDANLDIAEMNEFLKNSKSRSGSSCPNIYEWRKAFGDADEVFAIAITSSLSGSAAAARNAAEDFIIEKPSRRICVIDSLSTGPEMQLIIDKIKECHLSGMSFDETEKTVREYAKKTQLLFALSSMNNLAKNGRVSVAKAKLAGVLGIRAIGKASEEGTLQMLHTCRGEAKAISMIYNSMNEIGYNGGKVVIDHCFNPEGAEKLKAMILKNYPDANIKIGKTGGLCSFYAEEGGLMLGFES